MYLLYIQKWYPRTSGYKGFNFTTDGKIMIVVFVISSKIKKVFVDTIGPSILLDWYLHNIILSSISVENSVRMLIEFCFMFFGVLRRQTKGTVLRR